MGKVSNRHNKVQMSTLLPCSLRRTSGCGYDCMPLWCGVLATFETRDRTCPREAGDSDFSPLSGTSGLSVWSHFSIYISSLVLLPSLVALSVLSVSAFGLFSWPLFSFPKDRLVCVALVLLFERLWDAYFSWWHVQYMLPYGTSISL